MNVIWVGLGFAAFGLLVGTTAGLSTAELTISLLGLLFALIGGSVGAFLSKLDDDGKKLAGVALLTFSIFATIGIYSGIYVRINNLLMIPAAANGTPECDNAVVYLQNNDGSLRDFLRMEVTRERMSVAEACTIWNDQGAEAD